MKRLLPCLAAVALCGCLTLHKPQPTTHTYRLDYPPGPPATSPQPVVLRIAPVRVAALFDRDDIVYTDREYRVGSYPYEHWAVPPGEMISDLLQRDFSASSAYRAVQVGLSTQAANYQLQVFVDRLEEKNGGANCSAVIEARADVERLLPAAGTGKRDPQVLHRSFREEEPVPCKSPLALAGALSQALGRVSRGVQEATRAAIESDLAER